MKLRFHTTPLIGALALAGLLAAPVPAQAQPAACVSDERNGSTAGTSAQAERRIPCAVGTDDGAHRDEPARNDAGGERRSGHLADPRDNGAVRPGPAGGALGEIAKGDLMGRQPSSGGALQPLQSSMSLASSAGVAVTPASRKRAHTEKVRAFIRQQNLLAAARAHQ